MIETKTALSSVLGLGGLVIPRGVSHPDSCVAYWMRSSHSTVTNEPCFAFAMPCSFHVQNQPHSYDSVMTQS